MQEISIDSMNTQEFSLAASARTPIGLPAIIDGQTSHLLHRMFRDPRVLEPAERGVLITQLRTAMEIEPSVPEIRVILGMALCVDLQPQIALEELREAARQAPDCFIARLKFGELLMRLRICSQAAEETQKAAQLASNDFQAELARKQAATIRTMLREGIERGGYKGILARLTPRRAKSKRTEATPLLAGSR